MSYNEEIRPLRSKIDALNREILGKIGERVRTSLEIGGVKRRHGRPVRDLAREAEVLNQVSRLAEDRGLDPEAVKRIFREIIDLCASAEEAS